MTTGIFGNFFCGSEAGDCSLDTGSADGHDQNLQWKYKLKDTKPMCTNNKPANVRSKVPLIKSFFDIMKNPDLFMRSRCEYPLD